MTAQARALEWLAVRHPRAAEVTAITSFAWEMDDTDACGCQRFRVTIAWRDVGGSRASTDLEGEGLKPFWEWMVADAS